MKDVAGLTNAGKTSAHTYLGIGSGIRVPRERHVNDSSGTHHPWRYSRNHMHVHAGASSSDILTYEETKNADVAATPLMKANLVIEQGLAATCIDKNDGGCAYNPTAPAYDAS